MRAVLGHCTWLLLLVAALLRGTRVAAQPTADEKWSAAFRVVVQGRTVGSEQVSVARTPDGLTIKSSGGIEGSGYVLRSAEIVYGPTGTPLRLRTEARIKDQALIVDTSVADGKATSKVTQGETASEVVHEITNDAIFLPNNVFAAVQVARLSRGHAAGRRLRFLVRRAPGPGERRCRQSAKSACRPQLACTRSAGTCSTSTTPVRRWCCCSGPRRRADT